MTGLPFPGHPMAGKVCLVTGAGGAMGRAIAAELAGRGATVVLLVRTHDAGESLHRDLAAAVPGARLELLVADLARQRDIRHAAAAFADRHHQLHVLINNAGAHFRRRTVTADGIEMHLAVNHLGGFLLTDLLLDQLRAGAPSRIVNIASNSIADTRQVKIRRRPRPAVLNLDDLQSIATFDPMVVYAQSKLAMVMCGYLLARRLSGSGVTVNAVHPGLVATSVVDAIASPLLTPLLPLIKRFLLTPEQGAQAALHLATASHLETVSGKYFLKHTESRTPDQSYDTALQERLWRASAELVESPPLKLSKPPVQTT